MSRNLHAAVDSVPLLSDEDEYQDSGDSFANSTLRRRHKLEFSWQAEERDRLPEVVTAVFVVNFDVKQGNILEWSVTADGVSLNGVEFKALPSGAHRVSADFIVFKHMHYYGAACFETIRSEASARGATVKSVGILATSDRCLFKHRGFLEQQHYCFLTATSLVHKIPGRTHDLLAFFDKYSQTEDISSDFPSRRSYCLAWSTSPSAEGSVRHFLELNNAAIFQLWKLVMLRKRILFLSELPVENLCRHVFFCSLLGNCNVSGSTAPKCNSLFYIDLHDMDYLRHAENFIACTTEQIFGTKIGLYDALVTKGKVIIQDENLRAICNVNNADKRRIKKLLFEMKTDTAGYDISASKGFVPEEFLSGFFDELNDKILTAFQAALVGDRPVSAEDISNFTLDPYNDTTFLQAFAELHSIPVLIEAGSWCPNCRCC